METVELSDLYSDILLDHCRKPRNYAVIETHDLSGHAVNSFCGDEVDLQIALNDECVSAVGIQSEGCSINQASASILSETLVGLSIAEIDYMGEIFRTMMADVPLSDSEIESLGELKVLYDVTKVPVRIKCALLAWSALEEAIEIYRK